MKTRVEVRRADKDKLFSLAKKRIDTFLILKGIYNDAFLKELVKRKYNNDNLLLFWLMFDNPVATRLFKYIEENLKTLEPEGGIQKFNHKLRQWDTVHFESIITELEFAADYKRKGYKIELEPILPNGKKSDFSASKDSLKIYFELTERFTKRYMEESAIMDELSIMLGGMEEPFVVSIDIKKSFKRKGVPEVAKYIRKELRKLEKDWIRLPYSFAYPNVGKSIAVIDVTRRFSNGKKGYISGFSFGGGLKGSWSGLRSKIATKVSQLHPDYPGVIVLQRHGTEPGIFDVKNALLGNLMVNTLDDQWCRGKDRIFDPKKNKRLSAVIHYEKKFQDPEKLGKRTIYHNPYAETKLSPDNFRGEDASQIILTKLKDGTICEKQIN